mgnify:CR=1 FL=1
MLKLDVCLNTVYTFQYAVIQGTLFGIDYMKGGSVIINTSSTGGKILHILNIY